MMKTFPVEIKCKYITHGAAIVFAMYGLSTDNGVTYHGLVSMHDFEKLRNFCSKRGISCRTDNAYGTRNGNYRTVFFNTYKPVFLRKYYCCAYCGKFITRKNMQIDHLYPIGRVKQDPRLQQKLARRGIMDVNDIKNLVPACVRCNEAKKDHITGWIIKGKMGRHQELWMFRKTIKLFAIISLIMLIVYILKHFQIADMIVELFRLYY